MRKIVTAIESRHVTFVNQCATFVNQYVTFVNRYVTFVNQSVTFGNQYVMFVNQFVMFENEIHATKEITEIMGIPTGARDQCRIGKFIAQR